ncbi:hypothetical protein [Rhodoferax sp. GW822-FHT02A01]|uniref:hypothetical protein n=1 Tax=Rhodoferax sp. GW822-FHT02A01 TaxID=3141537 RepID=UPI00315CEB03
MGHKLSPHDNELYQRVDEVLHFIWDPIGVAGIPAARGEYNSYLPLVFQMLKSGLKASQVASALNDFVTGNMNLAEDIERSKEVAKILTDWRDALTKKYDAR